MSYIRKIIQRNIFVKDQFDKKYPFDLKNQINLYYKNFGDKNPNKKFFVIWREYLGSGFFSNFFHVANYINIAENMGMIPIVDFKNFKTLYNEKESINGTENSWEYYFKQISNYSLEEVYQSKNIFFCNGEFPLHHILPKKRKNIKDIWNKYIKLNPAVKKKIKQYDYFFENKVLGVHFRGKEQKYATSHIFPATMKQMIKNTDYILDNHDIDKIFLVTEEKDYMDKFIKRYGDKMLCTDVFRVSKVNSYNLNPRKNHRYLLGLEALFESILLSKCDILLYTSSNLSENAKLIGNHDFCYMINNGVNSDNPYITRYLYNIKRFLPKKYGGFDNKIIITKK